MRTCRQMRQSVIGKAVLAGCMGVGLLLCSKQARRVVGLRCCTALLVHFGCCQLCCSVWCWLALLLHHHAQAASAIGNGPTIKWLNCINAGRQVEAVLRFPFGFLRSVGAGGLQKTSQRSCIIVDWADAHMCSCLVITSSYVEQTAVHLQATLVYTI